MNNRFIKPKKSVRLGSDANGRLTRNKQSRPNILSSHQAKVRSPDPDDGQAEALQLDLPYVLDDGTILFWTGLVAETKPQPPEDK